MPPQALPIERCPQFRDAPPGSMATYNGKCYAFHNQQPSTFREALAFCRSRGGTLLDESNPALQGFVSWELWRRHRNDKNGQYWMGAIRDPADRNNWKWATSGKDVSISFWNLPGGGEDCARFDGAKGWLWSDTNCNARLNFICQHQPKTCGKPEQPPNSTILASRDFEVGSTVDYTCDPGHLLIGPASRTCLPTGFYNEFPPVCKRIECGFPADIPNGKYTLINGTVSYLSKVVYNCLDGYKLVGRAQLICDVDERWNGPPPRCQGKGIAVSLSSLSGAQNILHIRFYITFFTAHTRYQVNVNLKLHIFTANRCGNPPSIANGAYTLSRNTTTIGTVVTYSCKNRNYKLIGPRQLVCLKTGQYDKQPPKCQAEEIPQVVPGVGTGRPNKPIAGTPVTSGAPSTTPVVRVPHPTVQSPPSMSPARPGPQSPPYAVIEEPEPTSHNEKEEEEVEADVEEEIYEAEQGAAEVENGLLPGDSEAAESIGVVTLSPGIRHPPTRPQRPKENHISQDGVTNIIRSTPAPTPTTRPVIEGGERRRTDGGPKLNLGAIIALGVFGGFVFLAAVITTIIPSTTNFERHTPISYGIHLFPGNSFGNESSVPGHCFSMKSWTKSVLHSYVPARFGVNGKMNREPKLLLHPCLPIDFAAQGSHITTCPPWPLYTITTETIDSYETRVGTHSWPCHSPTSVSEGETIFHAAIEIVLDISQTHRSSQMNEFLTYFLKYHRNRGTQHYRHRASPDSHTVASFDDSSSGSEGRQGGLGRYYKQAWENLHESSSQAATAAGKGRPVLVGLGPNEKGMHHHPPLRRKETLDDPAYRMRHNEAEVMEKKRHHHHHHHHHAGQQQHRRSGSSGSIGNAVDREMEWQGRNGAARSQQRSRF
ncbi:hypothetical protein J437_LFUL001857 [Ladona fulva]|uniref:Sushi, von Willebrand factor type A, EGF and pentraxin domain-containing protein 1 n=1 Tax=Ladona fulva TaxID=123851 RepID=A0A8K0JUU7_LADFU|nr:hypothetical protein J437_LFUL001857 [Ladona fulva]